MKFKFFKNWECAAELPIDMVRIMIFRVRKKREQRVPTVKLDYARYDLPMIGFIMLDGVMQYVILDWNYGNGKFMPSIQPVGIVIECSDPELFEMLGLDDPEE